MNPTADQIGPCHNAADTARLLGVDANALDGLRADGQLLGVHTAGRDWLYPVWQFATPGLTDAIHDLPAANAGEEAVALWFTGQTADLADAHTGTEHTPISWIEAGHDPATVTTLARRTAREWTGGRPQM